MSIDRLVHSTLLASFMMAGQVAAEPFQILDPQTASCIDMALKAVPVRLARPDYPQYGEVSEVADIGGNFRVSLSVITQKQDKPVQSITHSFTARVMWNEGGGYFHVNQQSVSAQLNSNGDLVRIIEGGFSSNWNVSGYSSYTHALQTPEYRDDQRLLIQEWVENASQTMAFFGVHCLADQIYERGDGQDIRPPPTDSLVMAMR
ncbi:MAG: hypothetical protein GW903_07320 [Alphaproteobacteria bacterium]|nr:hypothetical protein [Alphaproteobacteria bacterium]NCQ88694.1 hypothetical protein [Alphaproteobacteria bacterium]NCT08209.1 hypothetical protein [Alphaproteobacteria bacterium]